MKHQASLLLFILTMLFSCSEKIDPSNNYPAELIGSYEVTYGSKSFVGKTFIYINSSSKDEIEIIPYIETGHPSFKVKVAELTNGNFGFTIDEQSTSLGKIEGIKSSGTELSGVYNPTDKSLAYLIKLTNSSVDEISVISNTKTNSSIDCFDKIKNNNETGVDCGGNCPYACVSTESVISVLRGSLGSEQFWSVGFFDENTGLAYANETVSSTLYKTNDAGKTWVPLKSPTTSIIRNIEFTSPQEIYIRADDGIYFSDLGGFSWTKNNTLPFTPFSNRFFYKVTAQQWVIGATYNEMRYSEDGGVTWKNSVLNKSGVTADIFPSNVTQFISETLGYTFFRDGSNGKMYLFKSSDGGKSWSFISQPLSKSITAIFFLDENNGFVVGEFNELLKTQDGGKTWSIVTDLKSSSNSGVYFSGTTGIVVGDRLLYSSNNGSSWVTPDGQIQLGYRQIVGKGKTVYAVAQNSIIKIDLTKIK